MSARLLESVLWGGAILVLGVGIGSARRLHATDDTPPVPARATIVAPPAAIATDSLIDAIEAIAEGNLFRTDRARAEIVGTSVASGSPPPPVAPAPPKPVLRLRGLIGGPPWDILIEGIPGHEGAVVARIGQTLGGITIRAIHRDTVIAKGMDTTWKLTLVRTW